MEHLDKDKEPQPSTSSAPLERPPLDIDAPIRDDGFGGNLGSDIIGQFLKISKIIKYIVRINHKL